MCMVIRMMVRYVVLKKVRPKFKKIQYSVIYLLGFDSSLLC